MSVFKSWWKVCSLKDYGTVLFSACSELVSFAWFLLSFDTLQGMLGSKIVLLVLFVYLHEFRNCRNVYLYLFKLLPCNFTFVLCVVNLQPSKNGFFLGWPELASTICLVDASFLCYVLDSGSIPIQIGRVVDDSLEPSIILWQLKGKVAAKIPGEMAWLCLRVSAWTTTKKLLSLFEVTIRVYLQQICKFRIRIGTLQHAEPSCKRDDPHWSHT